MTSCVCVCFFVDRSRENWWSFTGCTVTDWSSPIMSLISRSSRETCSHHLRHVDSRSVQRWAFVWNYCCTTEELVVIILSILMTLPPIDVDEGIMFSAVRPFVRSAGQIVLSWHLMNGLSSLDETYREYSLAPTDDQFRFWRSKVKVTAGRQGQVLWTPYFVNCLSNLNEIYTE